MGCCGDDDSDTKEGFVVKRRCRDVLCLLLFIAFWVGMFLICGFAFKNGEPNRILYGVDSFGMTCGSKNKIFNVTFDLTDSKNMYWLNPLDLLSASGVIYAKTVCSAGCPGVLQQCSVDSLPCTTGSQFTCPYYRFAEDNLYGLMSGVPDADITYWEDLASIRNITDPSAISFLTKLKNLGGVFATTASQLEANLSGLYYQTQSQFPGNGPCYPNVLETTPFFYRCFPKFPPNVTSQITATVSGAAAKAVQNEDVKNMIKHFDSASQKWARYVGDISRGVLVIVIGGLIASLVLSLLWLIILRYLGGIMVWLGILFINLCCIGACLFTWVKAGYIGNSGVGEDILDKLPVEINPAQSEQKTWFWIAIGASVVAGLVLLITLLCISRIKIAIACVKVASQAVGSMPSIIFFPVLPFILEVGLVIYWIAVTALMYSSGDLTANCRPNTTATDNFSFSKFTNVSNLDSAATFNPSASLAGSFNNSGYNLAPNATLGNCYTNVTTDQRAFLCGRDPNCYLSYDWNNKLKYAFIYHFFGLLWTNQVIVGFTCVTIAGAIAHFYWSRGDSSNMPAFPVLSSLKNTVLYHMGSICFAAFIIAVIQLIRAMLEYLDRKTKEIQEQNKVAEWAMCCIKCCMWCLEQIVKFINRNAYIMIAIKGKGYCCSAIQAVKLIISNALRISVVNLVADVLIFLGKVSVAAASGVVAYAMTEAKYYTSPEEHPDTYLYSPVLVIAISVIIAFVVAEIFFSVYEMAIDTIILAFCEDCDANDGHPKFAPELLMEVMGGPKDKDEAAKAQQG
ncbi:hypothetical protein PLESTB_001185800 [Pleodorina starrii]|uniref:Choline transporter-like protein n=1 Tax=Pleodorina starrii TaxID=330485 RepID=A0A9W6BS82_9CHLO|nr:hypothetical protein PLESTM_000261900 [Pleodorina starrii]GLC57123.1 hypothetical protein PLESTB_001185800 [Pleodorina starrii]GLC64957.1 hypothetical protein PLESTF_000226000 [Pleodorina starrii]